MKRMQTMEIQSPAGENNGQDSWQDKAGMNDPPTQVGGI
jgi:hypothetical protein